MVEPAIAPPAPASSLLDTAMAEMGLHKKVTPAPAPVAQAPVVEPPVTGTTEITQQLQEQENPIAPPVPVPAAPEVMDEAKLVSGILDGRFKSVKELAKAYKGLEDKSKESPFANPVIAGLDKFVRGGGDADLYMALQKLNLEKMTPRDLVVHQLVFEKGYSHEDAQVLVDDRYKIGADLKDENDMEVPGVRAAQLELKGAAHDAKKYLEGFKSEHSTPPKQKELEQSVKVWESAIPKMEKGLTDYTFKVGEEEVKMPMSEAARKGANETITEMIKSGTVSIDPDSEEGREFFTSTFTSIAKAHDFDALVGFLNDYFNTKAARETHNPRPPAGDESYRTPVDPDILLAQAMAKARGVNLTIAQ